MANTPLAKMSSAIMSTSMPISDILTNSPPSHAWEGKRLDKLPNRSQQWFLNRLYAYVQCKSESLNCHHFCQPFRRLTGTRNHSISDFDNENAEIYGERTKWSGRSAQNIPGYYFGFIRPPKRK